jgi:voltage-dependent calcium channel L type alpha-1D
MLDIGDDDYDPAGGEQLQREHSKSVYDENYNADEKTPIDEFDAMVDDAGMSLGDDEYTGARTIQLVSISLHTGARPRRLSEINIKVSKSAPIPPYSSLFLFSPTNPIRVFCNQIINHSYFTNSVLVCILVSSSMLAMEDPLQTQSAKNMVGEIIPLLYVLFLFKFNNNNNFNSQILRGFDIFFTVVFTIEISLKVIVYGFIVHKGSFCRSSFNLLDILVVGVSLASQFLQ